MRYGTSCLTLAVALIGCLFSVSSLRAQTATADVTDYSSACPSPQPGSGISSYNGVCEESFAAAISAASTALNDNPNLTYTLTIPAGTFDFSDEPGVTTAYPMLNENGCQLYHTKAAIILNGIWPTGTGRFILQGAGKTQTILVTSDGKPTISGAMTSHITISDMTLTRPILTVSQGTVVSTGNGYVTLSIATGFPTPLSIGNAPPPGFDPPAGCPNSYATGRYLMRYDYTDPSNPVPYGGDDHSGDPQVPWGWVSGAYEAPTQDDSGNWTIYYNNPNLSNANYTVGSVIAIKSKQSVQSYDFDNRTINQDTGDQDNTVVPVYGSDILFDRMIWKRQARGVFRGGFTNVQVLNSQTLRETVSGTTEAISSPAGGPQFNQPDDPQPTGTGTTLPAYYTTEANRVDHWTAVGTGDDSVAFFNDNSPTSGVNQSVVQDSSMTESFARDLFLNCSPNVRQTGVTAPYILSQGCS